MINANLAALIETPGVLDAAAFAIVLCRAETLLVGVKRPREEEYDHAEKRGCEDRYVLHRSSHVVPLDWSAKALAYISTLTALPQ